MGSCVVWLAAIRDAGDGPVAPPISGRACTVVLSHGGWVTCIWIVYTRQISVEVLQMTRSLLLRIILWCQVIVCFLSCSEILTVTKSLPGLLCRPVHYAGYQQCTVTVLTVVQLQAADIMERARVVIELGLTGSSRVGHLCCPRRSGPEGALR